MKILEVNSYNKLGKLFNDAGIEVSTYDGLPEGVIAAYEAYMDNELVGGVSIQKKKGEYVLFDIAIVEKRRGEKLGEELLIFAIERIKEYEAKRIYLVAKVPKFFEKYGFKYVVEDEVPPLFHCLTCDQYNVTCFPRVMKMDLGEESIHE